MLAIFNGHLHKIFIAASGFLNVLFSFLRLEEGFIG